MTFLPEKPQSDFTSFVFVTDVSKYLIVFQQKSSKKDKMFYVLESQFAVDDFFKFYPS